MQLVPEFSMGWNSAFILGILVILFRYGLMRTVARNANKQADFFPPMIGFEKIAYWIYTIDSYLIFLYMFFITIKFDSVWFIFGMLLYVAGLLILAKSTIDYAKGYEDGFVDRGIYLFSRNPMYLSYFFIFIGMGLICASWLFILLVLIREGATYWLILAEERWCKTTFGSNYEVYFQKVKRYFGRR